MSGLNMIDAVLDTYTMYYKPIPDHYHKYAGKMYGEASKRLFDTRLNIGKRINPLGRHPHNIITEDTFK